MNASQRPHVTAERPLDGAWLPFDLSVRLKRIKAEERRRRLMTKRTLVLGALVGILTLPLLGAIATATVVPPTEGAQTIVIKDLTVHEDSVSGTVVNKSPATVRDIALLLRQGWQWKDELHPGADSLGRTLPFTLAGEVAANASAPFTFHFPPLEQRSDGRYVTTMDVTGFTEVGP